MIKLNLLFLIPRLSVRNSALIFPVNILGSFLHPTDTVPNLGVWFMVTFLSQKMLRRLVKPASTGCLTFIDFDSIVLKKWLSLLQIHWLVIVWTIVTLLFRCLSCFNQHKLYSIQITLACFISNHRNRKNDHVTGIIKNLHCQSVNYHCMFKTTTLV